MRRFIVLALLILSYVQPATAQVPLIVETDPLTPDQQQAQFHLPEGFEVELIASEPDIGQPMNLNFDAGGRLWVTHALEYPYPARGEGVEPRDERFPQIGEHEPRDKLSVIENVGTPDQKITHFATGLNIPIGNMPTPRGAILYSIPDLWFCPDADGDLRADSRSVLYGRFGNIDTHGMVSSLNRWIDGWIYATHGFRNTSHVKGRDGHEFTMNSGNTFRFREDGSHIEQFTWGQVNPFGMTFDPWGNNYTADCHSMPLTGLIRGAYYSSFGKPHDGLGFGPDMIDHIHGSTGICGAEWYQAEQFPEEYQGCIFLCNPVNGQVHRDRIDFHGSSPWVVTQPEFLTCDDGWFRPVDVQLGPDGALYVADFYNSIIGHYEVRLDHPRRDREHGRIWRISYRADKTPLPDLAQLDLPELVERMADPNITVRTLTTNEIFDRFGVDAIEACVRVLFSGDDPQQIVGAAWLLERLGALPHDDFARLLSNDSDQVRTHAVRILAERANWDDVESEAALKLLEDRHPMVRRAAADALGRHPQVQFVSRLLDALASTDDADPFLRHTIRIALRDHLLVDEIARSSELKSQLDKHSAALADVSLGAHTEASAEILLAVLNEGAEIPGRQTELLHHLARYAPVDQLRSYVGRLAAGGAALPDQHREILALVDGLEARSTPLGEVVGHWAESLLERLLAEQRTDVIDWTVRSISGRALAPDAFATQSRGVAGAAKTALFHSSLPNGERKTGILRSEPFACPDSLTFYLAGHDGFPDKPAQGKNLVRLSLAESGEEIASAAAPRNDLAQKVEWTLDSHRGEPVRLEIVDGDDAGGYAWIAAGNFSLPGLNPLPFSARDAAAELITRLGLDSHATQLAAIVGDEDASLPARLRWSNVLLDLKPDARLRGLVDAVSSEITPADLRERVLAAVVRRDEAAIGECLKETVRLATAPQQRQLAEQLSADLAGSEALLRLTSAGLSSPRLLLDARIAERVRAATPNGEQLIARLTEGLPEPAAEIEKLIADRRQEFTPDGTTSQRGRALFKQHCAACHKLGDEGKKVGPVLDGIGLRGADRLFEDILDPSRNVDAAFRTTTILDQRGQVLTGLLVREEGATLVLVDNKGKEFTVPKADIDEQNISGLSLMPGNWGEVIPPADLNEIVAEMLRSTQKP